ncbi:MAG: hypothetical protein HZB53_14055 [Chloroflexi bacterium]|nr:hypothetical protein [Chloroflexota bacterium]
MAVAIAVSKPTNGTHFVAGDKPVVTVTLKDSFGAARTKDDFATMNLYIAGPQDPLKTKTAVKLLNADTDRTKTPHHYIDLLKNPDAKVDGNVVTYALKSVTDEEPGTYIVTVWAVLKDNGLQQQMPLVEVQIGTATVEKQITDGTKCQSCHKGADSGKFYMHHIDPGRSPVGSWSIDSDPVRTCKACHNNDGYAAYTGDINTPASTDATLRTPDSIMRRAHGVHMGEELKNPFNIDPVTGNFKAYTGVVFPSNVKDCATCHLDDRYKTVPTRQACGSCHDATWFGATASMPKGFEAHKGGAQANDAACTTCHPAADSGAGKSVTEAHKITQIVNTVAITMTAPANGKFYAKGDKPVVTLVIKDDKGNPIDHAKVDNANFATAGLFVYGPRYESMPVLTMAAKNGADKLRASASSSIAAAGTPTKVWTFNAGDTFKIAVNGNAPQVLAAPAGPQTPDQVRDWLKGVLKDVTVTSNATAGTVSLRSNLQGAKSRFEIYDSPVTKIMGWKPGPLPLARGGTTAGTMVEPFVIVAQGSYAINDLRALTDPLDYADPTVTRSAGNITYPLDDVAGLKPGTYMIYSWIQPVAGKQPNVTAPAIGFMTFQVGTATVEPKVATNCADCHGKTIFHLDAGPQHPEPFDTDYCKACHDYARMGTGDNFSRLGGTSTSGWSGYGAMPLAKRLHAVHFGRYLDYPEGIYAGNPNAFNEVIFPQDVRNCTKCHDPKGSAAWKQNPSRLACLACHDSDKARTHAKFNTDDPTPADPWSGDEVETCTLCHGAGRDYAPDKAHNVANPYKPPYVREP